MTLGKNVFKRGSAFGQNNSVVNSGLLFQTLNGDSALANLPTNITCNSITVAPFASYVPTGASGSGWTAEFGGNLDIASSGSDPTLVPSPFTDNSSVVRFDGSGKVYQALSTETADIASEDIIVEIIFKGTTSVKRIFDKRTTAAGYDLAISSGTLLLTVADSTTSVNIQGTASQDAWHHAMCFIDRSESTATNASRWFVNGASAGSGVATNTLGSFTNSLLFTIGSQTDFTSKWDSDIALVRLYKRTDWFAGGAQNITDWTDIAVRRMSQVAGAYPQVKTGQGRPTMMTRTSSGYLDIINTSTDVVSFHLMGSNWPRVCRRKEQTGGEYITGYLAEPAATNVLYGWDLTNATNWTVSNVSVSASGTGPLGTAYALINTSASNVQHNIYEGPSTIAGAYWVSAVVKAGIVNHFAIRVNGGANGIQYFNLSTGAVGTASGADILGAFMVALGDGWYRCFTRVQNATTVQFYATNADNTLSYTEANTTDPLIRIQAPQCEAGYPTSPIVTVSGTVTRAADNLRYSATSNTNMQKQTMVAKLLARPNVVPGFEHLITIGTSASDTAHIQSTSTGFFRGQTNFPSGSSTSVTASAGRFFTGEIEEFRFYYDVAANEAEIWEESTSRATGGASQGTSAAATIFIGANVSGAVQPAGLINNVRIYSKRVPG